MLLRVTEDLPDRIENTAAVVVNHDVISTQVAGHMELTPRRAAGSGQATGTAPGIQVLFLCMPRSPLFGQQKVFARCGVVAGGQLDYPA